MKEFDYGLDYKKLDFTNQETRKLYRIGRGEQGVLLVRPYTNDICAHWRFKTPHEAIISSHKIYEMYVEYKKDKDFMQQKLEDGHVIDLVELIWFCEQFCQ